MLKIAVEEMLVELKDIESRLHAVADDTDLSLVSIAFSLRRLAFRAKKLSRQQNRSFELSGRDRHRVKSLVLHAKLLRQVLGGISVDRVGELQGVPKSTVQHNVHEVIKLLRHFARCEVPEDQLLLALPWTTDDDLQTNVTTWLEALNRFDVELGRLAKGIPSLVNAWVLIFPMSFGGR